MNHDTRKRLKVIFFTPHADDIEIGTPFIYFQFLRSGHDVIEVLMTNNEFGTTRLEFKGKRIRRIRERELINANKVYESNAGNNKIQVKRFGFIDGYLPLDWRTVKLTMDCIIKEHPDIIFTCDPWYAQDYHPDHLNTGRLVYFALKKLSEQYLPKKVLYYYSTRTDFYIRCSWNDFEIIEKAIAQHRSQYTPVQRIIFVSFYNKLSIIRHLLEKGQFSESFRVQKIANNQLIQPIPFDQMKF
jgi:LmbE family N-acetylglucosaminyl deacetylase